MKNLYTFLTALLITAAALGQPGSLDPSLGNGGFSIIDFENNKEYPEMIALQPDGKLVVAGFYQGNFTGYRFLVARFTENGLPDLSFGDDGLADIDMKGWATGVATQDDGKIVVVGGPNADDHFLALRLLEDGSSDLSFGDEGKVVASFGDTLAICESMALLPDGRILLVGEKHNDINNYWPMAVMLFADGAVDPSFGDSGVALFPEAAFTRSYINDVQVEEDGKIVLGGYRETSIHSQRGWALWRFSPGGEPDLSFGPNGSASIHMGDNNGYDERINKIRIQPDGSVIAVGFAPANGILYHGALARYLPDGSLDTSFGQNGKAFPGSGALQDVWVQPDQKILAVGSGLYRFLPDGSPDSGFGTNGAASIEVMGSMIGLRALLWQPDNKVVAVGQYSTSIFPIQRDILLSRFYSGLEPVSVQQPGIASPWAVFPNPCRDFLSVQRTSGDSPPVRARLFNMAGQLALSEELQGRSWLSVRRLPAGMYGLEIEDRDGRLWQERVMKAD